jgi:hypothetical protein
VVEVLKFRVWGVGKLSPSGKKRIKDQKLGVQQGWGLGLGV